MPSDQDPMPDFLRDQRPTRRPFVDTGVRGWFRRGSRFFPGAVFPSRAFTLCVGLTLTSYASAEPPPGNLVELQKLNRASESSLREIQRPSGPPWAMEEAPESQKYLYRWQQGEQQRLQERQRREILRLNHRARIGNAPPPVPYSLQGIDRQRRFQLQQENQLNRFRLQR